MARIIHMMGPTCAGKSTLIKRFSTDPTVGAVEIGKLLRAKYGEAYFQGQAAPQSTADEALQMYFDTVRKHIDEGKKTVLIDGQPRDLDQCRKMRVAWPGHEVRYLLVTATHEDREIRARAGREPGPNLDLALARLNNDYKNNYVVMTELLKHGERIEVVDTSAGTFKPDVLAYSLGIKPVG